MISSLVLSDTIQVPGDYSTIQQAIDAAVNGDTVMESLGRYIRRRSTRHR